MSISDRLDEITARAGAATEGPWSSHAFGHSGEGEPSSIVVHRGKFDWRAIYDGEFIASMPRWDAQESEDAEFIAHARTDVPELVEAVRRRDAALRAVLDLHKPEKFTDSEDTCSGCDIGTLDPPTWPCPTVRAVQAALGEDAP